MRFLVALFAASLSADDHVLTLREALDVALRQNPDVVLSRLDEQRAALAVKAAKDPFFPKVYVGSGLAYTNGFPMSIEGSAPSLVQAKGIASIYNRPLKERIAQTEENARTAAIDREMRQDEIAHRTALLFLDTVFWARTAEAIRQQLASLEKAGETIRLRVAEGRDLEIEAKRSALAIGRARQRLDAAAQNADYAQASLALALGFPAADRVKPPSSEPLPLTPPENEEASIRAALSQSGELKRIESAILAKGHEIKSHRAARLPTVDLVAQYGLFARFNNYEDYFNRFSRHNGLLGVSLQLPVVPPRAAAAQASQGEIEVNRLRAQATDARNRITVETQRAWRAAAVMERSREVARLALDVARDQVNVILAQMEEGRATLRQLEEARAAEQERWLEYYDAQAGIDRARLDLLRQTGNLQASVR